MFFDIHLYRSWKCLFLLVFYLVWFLYDLPYLHLYYMVLYFMKHLVTPVFKDAIETSLYFFICLSVLKILCTTTVVNSVYYRLNYSLPFPDIWTEPDTFIWPTYNMERWHLADTGHSSLYSGGLGSSLVTSFRAICALDMFVWYILLSGIIFPLIYMFVNSILITYPTISHLSQRGFPICTADNTHL